MFKKGILHKIDSDSWTIILSRSKNRVDQINISSDDISCMLEHNNFLKGHSHLTTVKANQHTKELHNEVASISKKPHFQIFDKPLSSSAKEISFTYDQLRRCFGFRNIHKLLPILKETSQTNFSISAADSEPIADLASFSTIDKSKRNTHPVDLPESFGHTMHMDIVFGSKTAINGIKYGLFIVDRATRYKTILPLRNLTSDILFQLQKFCRSIGFVPHKFIADCDHKLFSLTIQQWLVNNNSSITVAPEGKQPSNGLCQRNWRSVLRMARGWIASAMIPSSFWWYSMKRAVEVANYLPIKIDNSYSTPHCLVYGEKPDLRNLLPMFSVAHIRKYSDPDGKKLQNTDSHSTSAILIGRSENSPSTLFYHPSTGRTIISDDFYLDEALSAGPAFGLNYQGGFHFHSYTQLNADLKAPTFLPQQEVFVEYDATFQPARIITLPAKSECVYTVQINSDKSMHQFPESCIFHKNPSVDVSSTGSTPIYFPTWIKHDSPATFFPPTSQKPQHGRLLQQDNEWYFRPGRSPLNPMVHLPNFHYKAFHLHHDLILFKVHESFQKCILLR